MSMRRGRCSARCRGRHARHEVIEQVRLLLRKQEPRNDRRGPQRGVPSRRAAAGTRRDEPRRASDPRASGGPANGDGERRNAAGRPQSRAERARRTGDPRRETRSRDRYVDRAEIGRAVRARYWPRADAGGSGAAVRVVLLEKPHGLGVGLSIVRSIVERFRGRVLAESPREGGAAFRSAFRSRSRPRHARSRAKSPSTGRVRVSTLEVARLPGPRGPPRSSMVAVMSLKRFIEPDASAGGRRSGVRAARN